MDKAKIEELYTKEELLKIGESLRSLKFVGKLIDDILIDKKENVDDKG